MLPQPGDSSKHWSYKRALCREILGETALLREATPDLSEDRTRFDLMFYKGRLGVRGPKKSEDDWDFEFSEEFSVDFLNVSLRTFIEEFNEKLPLLAKYFDSAQIRFRFDGKEKFGIWIDSKREELLKFSKSEECLILQKEIAIELGQKFSFLPPSPHCWLPSFSWHNEELEVQSYVSSFSQPGPEANRALVACGLELLENLEIKSWIELGAGYGNLTAAYASMLGSPEWILEKEPKEQPLFEFNTQFFPNTKLYTQPVETFKEVSQVDLLLADPPRSGFAEFFKKDIIKSKYLLLYNCDLRGLLKDTEALRTHYILKKWSLVDLFPGTPYAEAITLWERR